jgi:hypothetical protein
MVMWVHLNCLIEFPSLSPAAPATSTNSHELTELFYYIQVPCSSLPKEAQNLFLLPSIIEVSDSIIMRQGRWVRSVTVELYLVPAVVQVPTPLRWRLRLAVRTALREGPTPHLPAWLAGIS